MQECDRTRRQGSHTRVHGPLQALNIARPGSCGHTCRPSLGVYHLALSFAHRAEDVDEIRSEFGEGGFVISKIECQEGLRNLKEIAAQSDALLIDRGDLSREVPIEQIPRIQKAIIAAASASGRKVYVATNLMESMVTMPFSTRAEVNDVYNTLVDGADGLVLAAETAIGGFPVGCASMVVRITREFERVGEGQEALHVSTPLSLLVEPLGGTLAGRKAARIDLNEFTDVPTVTVGETALMDCELLANGTLSPVEAFMGSET